MPRIATDDCFLAGSVQNGWFEWFWFVFHIDSRSFDSIRFVISPIVPLFPKFNVLQIQHQPAHMILVLFQFLLGLELLCVNGWCRYFFTVLPGQCVFSMPFTRSVFSRRTVENCKCSVYTSIYIYVYIYICVCVCVVFHCFSMIYCYRGREMHRQIGTCSWRARLFLCKKETF